MKKIFSLVCAALLVLSASAASGLDGIHRVSTERISKAQLTSKIASENFVVSVSRISQSPAQEAETALTCNYVQCLYLGNDEEGYDGEWQIQFFNGNTLVFLADCICPDDSHIAGTYTFSTTGYDDIAAVTTSTRTGYTYNYITSGSMTISVEEEQGAVRYVFEFSGTGENNETYTLSYACGLKDVVAVDYLYANDDTASAEDVFITLQDYTVTPTGEVINIVFTESGIDDAYYEKYGALEFYGTDGTYVFDYILYVNEDIVGHYTEKSVADGIFGIPVSQTEITEISIFSCSFDVTESEDGYTISGSLISTDGIQYNIGNSATDIKNTKETIKPVKRITNGQLVIERNGVEYNAMGAQVK